MPITIGQLEIDEISGPVSVTYLVPTETSKMEVPILFLGDEHFAFDGMCKPSSLDTNNICLSIMEPLFYKVLDSLGSKHGMIDFYLEHDSKPEWMNDIQTAKLDDSMHHSTVTYLPTKHFQCFDKQTSQTLCFTKYIRYHFVDIRNADFVSFYTNVKKPIYTPKSSEHKDVLDTPYLDRVIHEQEDCLRDEQHIYSLLMSSREQPSTVALCTKYSLTITSCIDRLVATRNYSNVTDEYIRDILTTNVRYETALHRTMENVLVGSGTHHFFGYDCKLLLVLLLISPLDFMDVCFDFKDRYVQQYSSIYKQVLKLQKTNDLADYVTSTTQAGYKLFMLSFCHHQYLYHHTTNEPSITFVLDYLFGKVVNNGTYGPYGPLYHATAYSHQLVVTLLCPILDVYFLMRSMKMYGYDEEDSVYNKPSMLKVFHAGHLHCVNIISFLVEKGYYKILFRSSYDKDPDMSQTVANYRFKHQPYLSKEIKYGYRTTFDIAHRYRRQNALLESIWNNPTEIRIGTHEHQHYMLTDTGNKPVRRCRSFKDHNPIVDSIDSYIATSLSSKGLIQRRIRIFGVHRYLSILTGNMMSKEEAKTYAKNNHMTLDQFLTYVKLSTL